MLFVWPDEELRILSICMSEILQELQLQEDVHLLNVGIVGYGLGYIIDGKIVGFTAFEDDFDDASFFGHLLFLSGHFGNLIPGSNHFVDSNDILARYLVELSLDLNIDCSLLKV